MGELQILIIDDSISHRKALRRFIKPLNVRITEACDGQEGLSLALDGRFDLIITDVEMPQMNGIDLCRRLKRISITQSVPVIIVSSFDSDKEIDRGFHAGASAYISKKDLRESLVKTVKKVLTKSKFKRDRSIMVVDDSPVIIKLVKSKLARTGFRVITAENGKKALDLLNSDKPDLILSDINMPEMDGFAFCKAVHSDPSLSSIPFVVMSSSDRRSSMKRMIEHGAATYIVKPFNMDELVIIIEKILSDQFLLLLKERERLDTERKIILVSITSLVSALEARDAYTKGHSENVADILSGMISMTGAGRTEVETVIIGARLHDIGKIGIKDKILLKPGKLTDAEFAHIKLHPVLGAKILKSIPSLSHIVPIVLSHHEHFDGKGYPMGLKGDKIHYLARMTAVADTYDALTSDRPYRDSMEQEKALQIIEDVRGTQLCPDCVDLFFKWIASNVDKLPTIKDRGIV